MPEHATSALPGAAFDGFARVAEAGLCGMITLRGDLSAPWLATALADATGCAVPATRRVTTASAMAAAWMAPDEVLVICPHDRAPETAARLAQALDGHFATVADVSDARAVFTVTGPGAADVLAKICPVDFATLAQGDIRRTRAAQVAAAIWVSGADEMTVVCFRSVARYMFDLLATAAAPGAAPGLYA